MASTFPSFVLRTEVQQRTHEQPNQAGRRAADEDEDRVDPIQPWPFVVQYFHPSTVAPKDKEATIHSRA
jgi:hypothetical protein